MAKNGILDVILPQKMGVDEIIVGPGIGVIAANVAAGAAGVPLTTALPFGLLVGGLAYGFYRNAKYGAANIPGMTREEVQDAFKASALLTGIAMVAKDVFKVNDATLNAFLHAAEAAAATGGTAAATSGFAGLINLLATVAYGMGLLMGLVFVFGDIVAEFLSGRR